MTDGQATAWPGVTDVNGVRVVGLRARRSRLRQSRGRGGRRAAPGALDAARRDHRHGAGRVPPGGERLDHIPYHAREPARWRAAPWRSPIGRAPRASRRAGDLGPGGAAGARVGGGTVELEPDELRGDDVRYFAMWIGEPPAVAADTRRGPVHAQRGRRAGRKTGDVAGRPGETAGDAVTVVRRGPSDRRSRAHHRPDRPGASRRGQSRARARGRAVAVWCARQRGEAAVEGRLRLRGRDRRHPSSATPVAASWTAQVRYPLQGSDRLADTLARTGDAAVGRGGAGVRDRRIADRSRASTTLPLRAAFVPWIGDLHGPAAGRFGLAPERPRRGVLEAAPGATIRRPLGAEESRAPDGARARALGRDDRRAGAAGRVLPQARGRAGRCARRQSRAARVGSDAAPAVTLRDAFPGQRSARGHGRRAVGARRVRRARRRSMARSSSCARARWRCSHESLRPRRASCGEGTAHGCYAIARREGALASAPPPDRPDADAQIGDAPTL